VRRVKITKRTIFLKDDVVAIIEKVVTPYGNGAKVDCMKEYIGKRAYIVIVK
jgi:putative transposon-encoded protein